MGRRVKKGIYVHQVCKWMEHFNDKFRGKYLDKEAEEMLKNPDTCPYCNEPVDYLNHKKHLYMNCINQDNE